LIVLDASAAVEWLLGLPLADQVEDRLAVADSIHAPHLLAVEVAQVIRRYEATTEIEADRGNQALDDLAVMDLTSYPHEPLLPLIWDLRANLSAYDAAYVALGLALDAPVVTLDGRLARSPDSGVTIDLIL
jgi:predicted nucleic acid-binding protein